MCTPVWYLYMSGINSSFYNILHTPSFGFGTLTDNSGNSMNAKSFTDVVEERVLDLSNNEETSPVAE